MPDAGDRPQQRRHRPARRLAAYGIEVELKVSMPGLSHEQAEMLAHKAHEEVCPYSHATRNNVDVKITVV